MLAAGGRLVRVAPSRTVCGRRQLNRVLVQCLDNRDAHNEVVGNLLDRMAAAGFPYCL
jgi:hypothetical protein